MYSAPYSYLVDYFQLEAYLRWSLVIMFMLLKAGFIVAIFMHMRWERLGLMCAILFPPLALLGGYTFWTRRLFFGQGS